MLILIQINHNDIKGIYVDVKYFLFHPKGTFRLEVMSSIRRLELVRNNELFAKKFYQHTLPNISFYNFIGHIIVIKIIESLNFN